MQGPVFMISIWNYCVYDDIMDEISSFEELGKTIGKDKNSGKLTYVSLYGLEEAKNRLTEAKDVVVTGTPTKIKKLNISETQKEEKA